MKTENTGNGAEKARLRAAPPQLTAPSLIEGRTTALVAKFAVHHNREIIIMRYEEEGHC